MSKLPSCIVFNYDDLQPDARSGCLKFPAIITWPNRSEPETVIFEVNCFEWFNALTTGEALQLFSTRRDEIEDRIGEILAERLPPLQESRGRERRVLKVTVGNSD